MKLKFFRRLLVIFSLLSSSYLSVAQSFNTFLQAEFYFNDGLLIDSSPLMIDGIGYELSSDRGLENTLNTGYRFNGVSSWIDCTNHDRGIVDQLTISVWFKTNKVQRQVIASKYELAKDAGFSIGMLPDGSASLEGRDGSGSFYLINSGSYLVADGEWHHLVGVIDGSIWKLYVDCRLMSEINTGTDTPRFGNTRSLTIGKLSEKNLEGEDRYFDGIVDNFRLYNTALNVEQIDSISNYTCPLPCPDMHNKLVARYPLDGTAVDIGGNVLHGTVGGAVAVSDRFGSANAAMSFDGIDDYILVANADTLNFGRNAFAVSFWLKVEEPISGSPMLIQKGISADNEPGFWLKFSESATVSRLEAGVASKSLPPLFLDSNFPFYEDGEWHHLVFQRTDQELEIWVDAIRVIYLSDLQLSSVSGIGNLIFGAQNPGLPEMGEASIKNFFKGMLDDIQIYNCYLSEQEILEQFNFVNDIEDLTPEVGELKLYPNPVSEIIHVEGQFTSLLRLELELTTLDGRSIWGESWHGQMLMLEKDIRDLSDGIYLLRFYLPDYRMSKIFKIVKIEQ